MGFLNKPPCSAWCLGSSDAEAPSTCASRSRELPDESGVTRAGNASTTGFPRSWRRRLGGQPPPPSNKRSSRLSEPRGPPKAGTRAQEGGTPQAHAWTLRHWRLFLRRHGPDTSSSPPTAVVGGVSEITATRAPASGALGEHLGDGLMPSAGGFVRHYLRHSQAWWLHLPPWGPRPTRVRARGPWGPGRGGSFPTPPDSWQRPRKRPPAHSGTPLPSSCPHGRLPSLGKGAFLGHCPPLPASRSIGRDALRLQESHRCASPPLM